MKSFSEDCLWGGFSLFHLYCIVEVEFFVLLIRDSFKVNAVLEELWRVENVYKSHQETCNNGKPDCDTHRNKNSCNLTASLLIERAAVNVEVGSCCWIKWQVTGLGSVCEWIWGIRSYSDGTENTTQNSRKSVKVVNPTTIIKSEPMFKLFL